MKQEMEFIAWMPGRVLFEMQGQTLRQAASLGLQAWDWPVLAGTLHPCHLITLFFASSLFISVPEIPSFLIPGQNTAAVRHLDL